MGHVFLFFINVQFLLLDWELFSTEELESFVSEGPGKKVLKNELNFSIGTSENLVASFSGQFF